MKFRTGFVSNSSSSSFVILGFVLDSNIAKHLEDIARKKTNSTKTEEYWSCSNCEYTPKNKPKFCEHCGGEMIFKSRPKPLTRGDIINVLGLHYYSSPEYGPVVGLNISGSSVKEISECAEKLTDIVGSNIELIALGGAGLEL